MLRWLPVALLIACGSSGGGGTPDAAVPDLSAATPPTVLASAASGCLTLAAGRLFFVDERAGGNAITSVSTAGGMVQTHASGGTAKSCVAADDTYVYFLAPPDTDAGSLDAIARVKWGVADTTQVLASNLSVKSRLRLVSGALWWTTDTFGPLDGMSTGKDAIVKLSADGAGGVQIVFSDLTPPSSQLAVDAANVYYSDFDGMFVRALNGMSAPTPVGTSVLHLNTFAVDSARIALVEVMAPKMGDVAVTKLDGSSRTVVSPTLASSLAVDDTGVYANQGSQLVRFALDGSGTSALAPNAPKDIALDAAAIYFTDGASILKLGK
jgi:hypothetical protein